MATRIQLRRDTAANWASEDPTLAAGEPGWDKTNDVFKIGDGSTAWSSLAEVGSGTSVEPVLSLAADLEISFGSPARTHTSNRTIWWLMDASSIEQLSGAVQLPAWTTYDVELLWGNAGAGAGNVVWRFGRLHLTAEGNDVAGSGTAFADVTDAAGAQNALQIVTVASGITVPDGLVSFNIGRRATDGADTLANDAGVIALRFKKAS